MSPACVFHSRVNEVSSSLCVSPDGIRVAATVSNTGGVSFGFHPLYSNQRRQEKVAGRKKKGEKEHTALQDISVHFYTVLRIRDPVPSEV